MSVIRNQISTIKHNVGFIKPYLHQEAAITNAIKELKKVDRATVVMPCGTGKTLVCMWVAERLKAKNIVLFVPSLALIHQTALEWAKATSKSLSLMAICSDQTVALDEDGIIVEKDEFWFPVLSEPEEIKKFLKTPANNKEIKVVFCTYQSSFTLAEAVDNFRFDFSVCDEAHRTAVIGESYFSAPLFDEYIPINKRLFVTATPKQYSLNKKDREDDFAAVLSMDNEQIYGGHCHVLSFRKAIEQEIISDYKIIFPEVTSDMVADEMKLRGEADLSENAVYSAAMQIALKKAIQITNASKIITFHARVKEAEQFAKSLKQNKIIPGCQIYHVNGKQSSVIRKTVMHDFEGHSKSLITNARCLTEGIDAPSVDMVAILSNKKSKIDIIQAIGRALRKHPGKQCGYILVPVFVDTAAGETYEEALYKPEHQVLFELLLALEQHDELLCEAVKGGKLYEGYTGKQNLELLDNFFDITSQKILSSYKFRKALAITIIDRLGSNWDKMFGLLVKFKQQHGHCIVPVAYEDKQLASWTHNQCTAYKRGVLPQDRIDRLNALGFLWDIRDDIWNNLYLCLVSFKQKYSHCLVSSRIDKKLAYWINRQRILYKNGNLSEEKINLLNAIDFEWEPQELCWNKMYKRLEKFHKKFGHSRVPEGYKDKELAKWVKNQRNLYKKDVLPQERIEALNSLGFLWVVFESTWLEMYQELVGFYKEFGHCLVPKNYENKKLVWWVGTQRNVYKNKSLSQEKIDKLNAIEFVWDARVFIWQEMFQRLLELHKKIGHCLVPKNYENKQLALWVGSQRKAFKKGILSQKRIDLLNSIGFVWIVKK